MGTVSITPPKTPITSGFNKGTAKNTLPNICKMPGPPAPFVPSPLPNFAKSNMSPKGYSTKVKIEGKTVAIFGASFKSMGDIASKAMGGGLVSMNTHGPAKFIVPGCLTVSIEGKPVHLKGDMVLNNVGAAGVPPNTGATMGGANRGGGKGGKGGRGADYDCDKGAEKIESLVASNKHENGGDGDHGYVMRLAEQLCGKHGPGTASFDSHQDQLESSRKAVTRELARFEEAGCDLDDYEFHSKRVDRDRTTNIRDAIKGIKSGNPALAPASTASGFLGRANPRCANLANDRTDTTLNAVKSIIGF